MKKLSVFDLNKQLLFCLSPDPLSSQEKREKGKDLLRRIAGGEIYLESSRPEEENEEAFFASGLSMALEVVSDWDKKSEVSFAGYLLDKRIREEAAKCIEDFSFVNYPPPKGGWACNCPVVRTTYVSDLSLNRYCYLKWRYIIGWLTAPFAAKFTLLQLYLVLGYQQDSLFPYDTDL